MNLQVILSSMSSNSHFLNCSILDLQFSFRLFKTEKWKNLASITVLAIENVGVDEFENNPDTFQKMNEIFQDRLEVCNPIIEGINLSLALAYIPLTVGGLCRVAQGN